MAVSVFGVMPVLPSIFTRSGEIDFDGMHNVLEYIIASGADGFVFPGLASEYEELTPEERSGCVNRIGDWNADRINFVVGASANTSEQAAIYAREGAQAGASAAMIMTPRNLEGDVNRMAEFYHMVGDQTNLSIMLQNAPKPMGMGLPLEDIAKLVSRVSMIRSVKEETPPCGQRITELRKMQPMKDIPVFGGAGGRHLIDELMRGAHGTVPACEITEIHVAMLRAFNAGDVDHARDLFERSLPVLNMQAVFRWRLTKAVLKWRGLINCAYTRAPGAVLDVRDHKELMALTERIADLVNYDACLTIRGEPAHTHDRKNQKH